jgi:hypothetical protein
MPQITINHPTQIGISTNSEFLGENTRFRRTIQVSLSGLVLDLTAQDGVKSILDQLVALEQNYLSDWDEVIVDGINLGPAKMMSLSFSSGNDVRVKEYSASFEFYENGDLASLAQKGALTDASFRLATSVSETFQTEKAADGTKNYTRTISVGVETVGSNDGLVAAKTLAQSMLNFTTFPYSLILWGNKAATSCNAYYSESYDRINNEVSITQKMTYDPSSTEGYTVSRSHSFSFSDGVVNVTETANYKTKPASNSCFSEMFTDLKYELNKENPDGAKTRCTAVYNAYKSNNGLDVGGASLSAHFFERSINSSQSEGLASYSISYSNDKYYNDSCFWSKTNSLTVNEDGSVTVSQQGEITGAGHIGKQLKQKAANDYFSNKKDYIVDEIEDFYEDFKNTGKHSNPDLNLSCLVFSMDSFSVTKNNRMGKVSYSYQYSATKDKVDSSTFYKIKEGCSDQDGESIKLNSNYLVAKYKEIKYESRNENKNPEEREYVVDIVGKTGADFNSLISEANSRFTEADCRGTYVIGASYSFSPISNSLSASWNSIELLQ